MKSQKKLVWGLLGVVLIFLFIVDLSFGSVPFTLHQMFEAIVHPSPENKTVGTILLDFRMTKALTCILAGAALSLAGLQMQTLFRNPLAGPDVLGLTSGASLAVALIFMSNAAGLLLESPWSIALTASIGSTAVFVLMLIVSHRVPDNVSLLIIGLMVGAATSSIVSVLQFLSKAEDMQVFIIWTFGSLNGLNWMELSVLFFALIAGVVLSVVYLKSQNAWLLGERYAKSMGINIRRARFAMILSTSILTGAVTAFCGPIAFIGLAVPHLVKIITGQTNHRTLVPGVLLGGATLLLFCDVIAQIPSDYILPINAITAMIGAPVVIWIVLRNRIVTV